ncbi:DUF5908 family protein [Lunatimonas salinarum]|uniref:DUF5908 family protein n=1 Tax=Lunatimonas salinarum TaxID=1774590 RepID=UPI001AE09F09|nr:DUF5908 family protein [Lunatimonas salinarum]
MPIEIKELNIRIHVGEGTGSQQTDVSGGKPSGADTKGAELMEDIMEALRLQKER